MLTAQQPQCTPTRHMADKRHFARHTRRVRREGFAKERLCSRNPAVASEQKINGLSVLVNGALKVVLPRFDRDVSLIDSPRRADGLGEWGSGSSGTENAVQPSKNLRWLAGSARPMLPI